MKRIMLITLILLLFVSCSAVYAENNMSDEVICDNNLDENSDLKSSELNDIELEISDELKTNDSKLEADEGEYVDASEAYDYLNAFRTEENVWYWNADDATQSHVNTNDTVWLKPLERDIELENTAKIRAKELVEEFSHVRPDGTICFTIFPKNLEDYGENIAYGYEDSFEVTEGWKETNEPYSGQGHRRNMLQADYNYVGIAGYKVNGTIYWVQNFGCRNNPKDITSQSTIRLGNNTASPKFSVEVPKYASGSFYVTVNGIQIDSKSISNGKADITVCGLKAGKYNIYVEYSGDHNYNPINKSGTVVIPNYENTLTFNELNTLTQMSDSNEIKLENDYAFDSALDSSFQDGISISRPLTIDGQGHSIDGKNMARIFQVNSYFVTFKNIRLINANVCSSNPNENKYFDDSSYGVTCYYYGYIKPNKNGGAIFSTCPFSVINSVFSNNKAYDGGAIYCDGDIILENSSFLNNHANDKGGAIYSYNNIAATNTNFTDNYALDLGGAVYSQSALEATGSIFKNNNNIEIFAKEFTNNNNAFVNDDYMKLFTNASKDNGKVTLNKDYTPTGTVLISASNVTIDGNGYTVDAKNKCRLFYITGDNVTIKNIRFINGNTTGEGGAIYTESSDITIMDSLFSNCLAQNGGVIYGNSTNIGIKDCSFKNNYLKDFSGSEITEGGVICTRTGTVFISNSNFANNTAFYGGVIHTDTGFISIRDSYFENNTATLYGGGVSHSEADAEIINSIFINNYAERYGGAIFFYGESEIYVENSIFTNNTSNHYGGAVSASAKAEIINSTFERNCATDHGGTISIWGELLVANSNFTNNIAEVGGAIFDYSENSTVLITHSNFTNNTQKTNGVLYITSNVIVEYCDFINNKAYDGTTAAIENFQNLTVENCKFINNSVARSWGDSVGGAITNYGENLIVKDSLFKNNYAARGGAIANYQGNALVDGCSFINNSAIYGGGIYNHLESNITATNSIFENNTAEDGGAMIRGDADNCTFIQNFANNYASAMYGVPNTAKNCRFIKNIDYVDGPTWNVNTTDCTFKDNKIMVKSDFNSIYLESVYYQGEILFMDLISIRDYTHISNATVTIRAYKNNVLAGEFEYVSGEGWNVNIQEGSYIFEFSVENQNYIATPLNISMNIMKKEIASVDIALDNNTFLSPTIINITSNLDGIVELYLDDGYLNYFNVKANEKIQDTYNYIQAGNHVFKVIMTPSDYHFDVKTFEKNFTVFKKPTSISVDVENTSSEEGVLVYVKTSDEGIVTVNVGEYSQTSYVNSNTDTLFDFGILNIGTYIVTAQLTVGENFVISNASKTLKVSSKISQEDIEILVPQNNSKDIVIKLPSDAKGKVTLTIAGENYDVDVIDGKATVKLPDLTGDNTYTITYSGDEKYAGFNMSGSLDSDSSNVKLKPNAEIPPIENELSIVKLPADATGTVTLTINGENYSFEVSDGIAYVILPELKEGSYDYTITYSGDNKYLSQTNSYSLVVSNPVEQVISASNIQVTYNTGSYYTITVYGTDGMPANDADVVISGKISKSLKTTNGIAKFKVTQAPGKYEITITSLGISTTKTITVKHLVSLKSVTVKKSAKKLVLQATLAKVNGKYLKSKQITFKFNGKTYKAKTSTKGVAKVTIKKTVLKKLKVGKKVTYQATYLKDTVKKSIKVKK